MRIVHFTTPFLPRIGGAEISVHNLARQQRIAGHEVYVLTGWARKKRAIRTLLPYTLLLLPPRLQMGKVYKSRFWKIALYASLFYLQRRYQFDVWHLHFAYPIGSALPILQKLGMDPVLNCRGADVQRLPDIEYGHRLDPEINDEVTRVLRKCKKLVAMSTDLRNDFVEAGCGSETICDIPNGVAYNYMQSVPTDRVKVREEHGLPPQTHIIITTGRNHPKKAYHLIPEVLERLTRKWEDIRWIIVGRDCEPIKELAACRGIQEHLIIIPEIGGWKEDGGALEFPSRELIRVMKASDVFAFPTRIEGHPMVILEALAVGLPVVSTDVPGVRDLVINNVNGFMAQEGDTEAMTRHIDFLLSDVHKRTQMGQAARIMAQKYDWEIIAQKYIDLYTQ